MRVAVVGATGAVGTLLLRTLAQRGFEAEAIVPYASQRSAGRTLEHATEPVREFSEDAIEGFDLALFSAGGSNSKQFAPAFVEKGAVVVDNSSAFRMDDDVPLVVSEVNPEAIDTARKGIVANPNCTTMVIMLPAKALHDRFGLVEMTCTSFQAAGGAGEKGMAELREQVPGMLERADDLVDDGAAAMAGVEAKVHAAPLAFNVVPWLGSEQEGGYTDEELKMLRESRKILGLPELRVAPTCVRVPVMNGHAVQVRARFEQEVDVAEALRVLDAFPNLVHDPVPTPLRWAGRDETAVGRVRADLADPRTLNFFVVGDNLRKGAALNTVQLAELAVERGLVGKLGDKVPAS